MLGSAGRLAARVQALQDHIAECLASVRAA